MEAAVLQAKESAASSESAQQHAQKLEENYRVSRQQAEDSLQQATENHRKELERYEKLMETMKNNYEAQQESDVIRHRQQIAATMAAYTAKINKEVSLHNVIVSGHQKDIERLELLLQNTEAVKMNMEKELKAQSDLSQSLSEKCVSIQIALESEKDTLDNVSRELQQERLEHQHKDMELREIKLMYEDVKKEKDLLIRRLKDLKLEIHNKRLTEKEVEVEKLCSDLQQALSENEDLQLKLERLQSSYQSATADYTIINNQYEDLKVISEQIIKSLKKEIERLEILLQNSIKSENEIGEVYNKLQNKLVLLESEKKKLMIEKENEVERLELLLNLSIQQENKLGQLLNDLSISLKENTNENNNEKELKEEMIKLHSELYQLQKTKTEDNNLIFKLKQEIENLEEIIQQLSHMKNDLNNMICENEQKFHSTIQKLENIIMDKDHEIEKLESLLITSVEQENALVISFRNKESIYIENYQQLLLEKSDLEQTLQNTLNDYQKLSSIQSNPKINEELLTELSKNESNINDNNKYRVKFAIRLFECELIGFHEERQSKYKQVLSSYLKMPLSSIQITGLLSGSVIINTFIVNIATMQMADQLISSVSDDDFLEQVRKVFGNCQVHTTPTISTTDDAEISPVENVITADANQYSGESNVVGDDTATNSTEERRISEEQNDSNNLNKSVNNTTSDSIKNDNTEIVYVSQQALELNAVIEHDVTVVRNLAEGHIPLIDLPIYSSTSSSSKDHEDILSNVLEEFPRNEFNHGFMSVDEMYMNSSGPARDDENNNVQYSTTTRKSFSEIVFNGGAIDISIPIKDENDVVLCQGIIAVNILPMKNTEIESHNNMDTSEEEERSVKLIFQKISVSDPQALYKLCSQTNTNDDSVHLNIFANISINSINYSNRTQWKSVLNSEHTSLEWNLFPTPEILPRDSKLDSFANIQWELVMSINELKAAKLFLSFHSTPNLIEQSYEKIDVPVDDRTIMAVQKIQAQVRGYLSRKSFSEMLLEEEAKELGVLVATGGTKQG